MIFLTVVSLIVSFIFQGLISNYLGYTFGDISIFFTIYVLINLLVLKPFYDDDNKYILLIVIVGILTDVIYSNLLLSNICIFLVVAYFARIFYSYFPYNMLMVNICNLICISIYHCLSFLVLYMVRYDQCSFMVLIRVLYSSVIMTVVYSSFLYFVFNFFRDKFELKEIK